MKYFVSQHEFIKYDEVRIHVREYLNTCVVVFLEEVKSCYDEVRWA